MSGTLYLCATPIGNLEDMTPRVIRTMEEVDLIACEDTRNSMKLFQYFNIRTPYTSYHEHNKFEKAEQLIQKLKEGTDIALITDAGTPAISDPGEILVKRCQDEGIVVTSLPGACALITALTLSGLSTRRFCFEGFLSQEKKERNRILKELEKETRTIIIYEAPHKIKKTIQDLRDSLGNRKVTLCRELTKKFETIEATTLEDALSGFETREPRGEYVLVIEGKSISELDQEEKEKWKQMSLEEHVLFYQEQGMEQKTAMKKVADDRGITKRDVYQELLKRKGVDK